jgi:transposase InsO family protein
VPSVGRTPFENLIVDFAEMPWARGCKYLLVFVCTFSGLVEAFPIQTEKAREVARCLLKEIIPWFRIPVSIGLDNGPVFVAEVIQLVVKGLGITWKLHTAYCPPELRESRTYEQDSKIATGKTMLGDPHTMGSVAAQSLAQD